MSEDLDFSLPKAKNASEGKTSTGIRLLLVVQLLTLALLVIAYFKPCKQGASACQSASAVSPELGRDTEKLLEYAQRLEAQGLASEAAAAWREYIAISNPDAEKEAKLWYRIGNIQQDGRLYEEALASYYRSDLVKKVPVLEVEITRRSQQCLEALGKAVAIKRNLEERTAMVGAAKQEGTPLVDIGEWKITKEDAERMAEVEIDKALASSENLSPEEKAARKAEFLKQFESVDNLMQFISQYVSQEVLYRAARDAKMNEDAALREEISRIEREVLASAYMRKQFEGLTASDSDVKDFYLANPTLFTQLAAVKLAHIEFDSEEKAQAALKSLANKEDFAGLAKILSIDKATADKGGEIQEWIDANNANEWCREAAKAILASDKPAKGECLASPVKAGNRWHVVKVIDRKAEKVMDFNDKATVESAREQLMGRKRREVQQRVFGELFAKYKVVWHPVMKQNQNGADK